MNGVNPIYSVLFIHKFITFFLLSYNSNVIYLGTKHAPHLGMIMQCKIRGSKILVLNVDFYATVRKQNEAQLNRERSYSTQHY